MTKEITKLLEKLYNLRGSDSVVLSKMDEDKNKAVEKKESTTKERESLINKIDDLTNEESILTEKGEKLVQALNTLNINDFSGVLDKLNINFNPEKLGTEVSEKLPKKITEVKLSIENAKKELVNVENEMNEAKATISELEVRRDEALNDQNQLNEYFELALEGNINITRESITSLLAKFNFSESEQREAAKILMFPEDALYEYEEKLNKNSESELIAFNETKEKIEIEEIENEKLSPKDELIKLLTELGFDYLEFTNSDLEKILINYTEKVLRNNVNYAKENNLKFDMFIDNINLLYDKEFVNKVERLVNIGKDINDVYLYPTVLVKYSDSILENIINSLRSSGLDPKKVPLIAY